MDTRELRGHFDHMGARLKVNPTRHKRRAMPIDFLRLDLATDQRGEYFELHVPKGGFGGMNVTDTQPQMQHLLLVAGRQATGGDRQAFLCGHDERHWFVAGVPADAKITRVAEAMEALKPREVIESQTEVKLKPSDRLNRHNAAYIRQGEWFFIPRPELKFPYKQVLHHEPISRGNGGKPHMVDQLFRRGGELVYVSRVAPQGLTAPEYRRWLNKNRRSAVHWRRMQRNATVFVRGCVRHPDHATVRLKFWHQVVMNTENQSPAMRHVVFLD